MDSWSDQDGHNTLDCDDDRLLRESVWSENGREIEVNGMSSIFEMNDEGRNEFLQGTDVRVKFENEVFLLRNITRKFY